MRVAASLLQKGCENPYLHYKSERSLAFSVFLDRMQCMFNIYEEEQEEFSENAKICELFKWVQHPQLQDIIKALKVHFDMEGLTYTQAANHLTVAVSELPEFHTTRRVAAAHIRGGSADTGTHNKYNNSTGKGAPKSGIRTADGKIFMGFYKHWWTLTDDEKQHIIEERKRKGNKKGTGGTKNNKRRVEELGLIQEQLHEMKRVVSELVVTQQFENHDEKEKKVRFDIPQHDAGNAFGRTTRQGKPEGMKITLPS